LRGNARHLPQRHARAAGGDWLGRPRCCDASGAARAWGAAQALYRNPAALFVARLFSEINELPLRVEGGALRTPIGVPGLGEGEAAIVCIRRRAIAW